MAPLDRTTATGVPVTVDIKPVMSSTASDVSLAPPITMAAPVTSSSRGVNCPGRDPEAVATFFVTSINRGDLSGYASCVHSDADRGSDSLFGHADWVSVARSVDAQLADEFVRFADTYSFGSPDLPPPNAPTAPQYWIDPNGRLDVTVKLEADGLYWVTRLSTESHA